MFVPEVQIRVSTAIQTRSRGLTRHLRLVKNSMSSFRASKLGGNSWGGGSRGGTEVACSYPPVPLFLLLNIILACFLLQSCLLILILFLIISTLVPLLLSSDEEDERPMRRTLERKTFGRNFIAFDAEFHELRCAKIRVIETPKGFVSAKN